MVAIKFNEIKSQNHIKSIESFNILGIIQVYKYIKSNIKNNLSNIKKVIYIT